MALNLQQMRDYVRLHLDLETDDLPDVLLDTFVREGSKRIERAEPRWPFYEATFIVILPADQTTVTKAGISTELDQITNIVHSSGANPPLKWIGFDVLQELLAQQSETKSRPRYWAEFSGAVSFFPKADVQYVMVVYGYRKATDWVSQGAGAVPDLPDELHNTVATWALARAYAQQEDPELAALYERQFADELNEFRRRLTITPHNQPLVLNGGSLGSSVQPEQRLLRPRFDWEVM